MKDHSTFDDKYMGKYRIPSARHPTWDYSSNGKYFVTICTHNRRHHFGKIINKKMHLSEIGKWADACWDEIPSHFPFVILHNHIIMPDHMHGIIEIAKSNDTGIASADPQNPGCVQTQNFASLPIPPIPQKNKFGPQSKNLASIIRGYKIGVTKNARKINPSFKWQARFYDVIVRNDHAFQNIQNYILNNPKKWESK